MAVFSLLSVYTYAQCEVGEIEVEFVLFTDDYGYEVYWELLPSGNECGTDPIATGGNELEVGCSGADEEDATDGNGYESEVSITVGPWCLTEGEFYDIIFVDDYTDGGLTVQVYENGELTHFFNGDGDPTVWTFQAGFPTTPDNDQPCDATPVEIDGASVLVDTSEALANNDEVSPNGGGCDVFGLWCEGNVTNSVWATFVGPESGALVISTCNELTTYDTQFALYTAEDCGDYETFELVSSNDDQWNSCGNGNQYASTMYASCLTPGQTYYIQIDGYFGETGIAELTVSSYEEAISLEALVDNVDCPNVKGDDSGAIVLLAFGTGIEYTATWTGPNGYSADGIFIENLVAGTYEVELETGCGETASGSFDVNVPTSISINAEADNATCEASSNGSINLIVSGATDPYEYFWTGPNGFFTEDQDPSDLVPGTYQVQVTDDNGCEFMQNVALSFDEDFQFSLGADATICQNEDYFLTGPAGYDYDWQDGSANQFFIVDGSSLDPGTYPFVLTASNDLGCEYTDAVFITVDNCIGLEESSKIEVLAYPNPSDGLVYISGIQGFKTVLLDVVDASGRIVSREQLNGASDKTITDLSTLSAGLYFLDFNLDGIKRQVRIAIK